MKLGIFIIITLVSFFAVLGPWLAAGRMPLPADSRAHIFRIEYFYDGMANGDYVPSQYHGYSFLAGYGTLEYAVGYALFRFFMFGFPAIPSSVYAFDALMVFALALMAIAATELIDELKKQTPTAYLAVALVMVLLPTNLFAVAFSQSISYVISFAFSLLALKYVVRSRQAESREQKRVLACIFIFSVLSIYTETFGYVFVLLSLLFLLPDYKKLLKLGFLIMVAAAFSWVQLIQAASFMTPFVGVSSSFISSYLVIAGVVLIYGAAALYRKQKWGLNNSVPYALALAYVVLAGISLAVLFLNLNLGAFNTLFINIMPDRLLDINFIVIALVLVFSSNVSEKTAGPLLVIVLILFVITALFLSQFLLMEYAPSPQETSVFSGHDVIATLPALSTINSSGIFGPLLNYSTTTGAYNQGDPSFFYLTAYYEWMNAFTNNSRSLANLMQMVGSDAAVTSNAFYPTRGLRLIGNSYGLPVYAANASPSLADSVTPIEVLSSDRNSTLLFSLYVNLLSQNGSSFVFTTQSMQNVSGYVELPGYAGPHPSEKGAKVISLVNASDSTFVEVNSTSYILYTPALREAADIFPYKPGFLDYYMAQSEEKINDSSFKNATFIGNALRAYFNPAYEPLNYTEMGGTYSIKASNLPVLLKVSYYPYFDTNPNLKYTYDVNHFILLPPEDGVVLRWSLHFYMISALVSLLAIVATLIYLLK